MKKSMWILAAQAFLAAVIFTGCNTPAKKVEDAREHVVEANQDLDKANKEYQEDINNYRRENAEKIAANERSIAEFNARIDHEKKDARAEYKKKIDELNQRNSDLKKKLDNYKAESKDKWEQFKVEFNHDMEEIGQSFKNLTARNTK